MRVCGEEAEKGGEKSGKEEKTRKKAGRFDSFATLRLCNSELLRTPLHSDIKSEPRKTAEDACFPSPLDRIARRVKRRARGVKGVAAREKAYFSVANNSRTQLDFSP